MVGCLHQHDCDHTLDIAIHSIVGLFTFGCEVTGEAFYSIIYLHNEETVYQDDDGDKAAALLEEILQILPLFFFICGIETFHLRLVLVT